MCNLNDHKGIIRIHKRITYAGSLQWEARLTLDYYRQGCFDDICVNMTTYGKTEEDAIDGLRKAILDVNVKSSFVDFSKRCYVDCFDNPIDAIGRLIHKQ